MSYILDALRKSERERSLGSVPTLETVQPSQAADTRRFPTTLVVVLCLALAVLALGWAFADRLAEGFARIGGGGDAPAAAPVVEEPQPAPPREVAGAAIPLEQEADSPAPEQVPVQPVTPAPVAAEPPAAPAEPEPAAPSVSDLSAAPADVRDALSRLYLSVVSYSNDPTRRFVMINQTFYREGDRLPGGVVLRRIDPDGAVVAYHDSEVLLRP